MVLRTKVSPGQPAAPGCSGTRHRHADSRRSHRRPDGPAYLFGWAAFGREVLPKGDSVLLLLWAATGVGYLQAEHDRVVELLQARRDLIASVARELRTPVAFLRAWLIIAFHQHPIAECRSVDGRRDCRPSRECSRSKSKYAPYYPWTLSGATLMAVLHGKSFTTQLMFGLAGGILVALIGCWEATRREVLP